jgi:ABC-2 type transport system ATP-binding protein
VFRPAAVIALALCAAACGDSAPSATGAPAAPFASGASQDVVIPSNVDGEAISFTVHPPTSYAAGQKYPLILEGHGYGGGRIAAASRPAPGDAGTMGRLLDAGYGVISFDQRGHGDSGGQIRILDPDFEGKDLVQALDWAEANLPWLQYRNGNLLLGAIGGSYGGGYQHTLYMHDPQQRLDAIAPEITWHDLRYSLFSGGVFKSFWAGLLSAAGNGTSGGQHQDVNDGLVNGLATNSLTQEQQDLLRKVSMVSKCEDGGLQPIDAMYWQSTSDTLFNLNDAFHNFQCVSALGGDVRLLTKNSGHDSLVGGSSGEGCGLLDKTQAIVDWYDEKLKGLLTHAAYIPQFCFHLDGTTDDGVVVASLPLGGQSFTVPSTAVLAQDGSVQVASIVLTTIGAGGAVLAGVPTIELTVADAVPGAPQLGDPIVFVGLARRAAGTTSDVLLQANQVRPFRGYGTFSDELVGATARLAEGDEIRLLVHAAFATRYAGSGSDAATPVNVGAVVGLPLHAATLPAPPAN